MHGTVSPLCLYSKTEQKHENLFCSLTMSFFDEMLLAEHRAKISWTQTQHFYLPEILQTVTHISCSTTTAIPIWTGRKSWKSRFKFKVYPLAAGSQLKRSPTLPRLEMLRLSKHNGMSLLTPSSPAPRTEKFSQPVFGHSVIKRIKLIISHNLHRYRC